MHPFDTPPDTLAETREALHRLAAYVIAPVRHTVTGRFGLRSTPGGFGTPEFEGRVIRVARDDVIDTVDGVERREKITTLQAAADFLGARIDESTAAEHDSPAPGEGNALLSVDVEASNVLGKWFEMAFAALNQVLADDASVDGSEPQLWPGHFDAAIELGDEDHRASYGASPGDHGVAEPYIYVSVWWPDKVGLDRTDPLWNAPGFVGSMLTLSDFPDDSDPIEVAAAFWRTSRDTLGQR